MVLKIQPHALANLESQKYPDVLTVQQAQAALGIGRVSIYNLIESGQLQAFRIGRAYKIPKKRIREFLDERLQGDSSFH